MTRSLRYWPVWALLLAALLASVWLSDDHTSRAVLTLAGQARPWHGDEARAMVGTWYLVDGAPDAADVHCARDVQVHYRLSDATTLAYTLECRTTDKAPYQVRGMVLMATGADAPVLPRWASPLWRVVLPQRRPVQMLEAVDHPAGLASVHQATSTESWVLSRSREGNEAVLQGFLLQPRPSQHHTSTRTSHGHQLAAMARHGHHRAGHLAGGQ